MERVPRPIAVHSLHPECRITDFPALLPEKTSPRPLCHNQYLRMICSFQNFRCPQDIPLSCEFQGKLFRRNQYVHMGQKPPNPRIDAPCIQADLYAIFAGFSGSIDCCFQMMAVQMQKGSLSQHTDIHILHFRRRHIPPAPDTCPGGILKIQDYNTVIGTRPFHYPDMVCPDSIAAKAFPDEVPIGVVSQCPDITGLYSELASCHQSPGAGTSSLGL